MVWHATQLPGCEGDSCRFNLDIATQMISVTLLLLITASPSTWIVIKNANLQAALWPELIKKKKKDTAMVFFWMEAQEDWQAQMVLRELLAQREKFSIDLYGLCELLSKGCNLQTTVAFTHTVHDVLSCAKILEVFLFILCFVLFCKACSYSPPHTHTHTLYAVTLFSLHFPNTKRLWPWRWKDNT